MAVKETSRGEANLCVEAEKWDSTAVQRAGGRVHVALTGERDSESVCKGYLAKRAHRSAGKVPMEREEWEWGEEEWWASQRHKSHERRATDRNPQHIPSPL